MKNFIAKRYQEDFSTEMSKSADSIGKLNNVINLSIGDPDFPTDSTVIEKTFEDVKNGFTHYADPFGDLELREEICKYYKEDFNFSIHTHNVFVTTSGNHAMWLALETTIDPGDEVIIVEPFFTPYPQQVKMAGGIPVFLQTKEEENFCINIEALKSTITNKTKAIILNTPNNPSGACMSKKDLQDLAKVIIENNLLVIADDIYTSYSFSSPFVPIATIENMKNRTISIRSFSKDYNMTGWRIGYIVAPKELIVTLKEVNENCVFSAPTPSQRAALYALQNRKQIQPKFIKSVKERADFVYNEILNIPFLSCQKPQGSLYLFVNIKKTGLTSAQFTQKLLQTCQVLTIPGSAFGQSGEGYIRIALTVSIEKLKEAFERIKLLKNFE